MALGKHCRTASYFSTVNDESRSRVNKQRRSLALGLTHSTTVTEEAEFCAAITSFLGLLYCVTVLNKPPGAVKSCKPHPFKMEFLFQM